MIEDDSQLRATRDRIGDFEDVLMQLRVAASPSDFPYVAGGYIAEIERMQQEVLEYLSHHESERIPANAA